MKVADLAQEVFSELSSPTDVSIPVIAYWIRGNVGLLNSLICVSYYINNTTQEIERLNPEDETQILELGEDEAAIIKIMYVLHYYDFQIRKNMISYTTSRAVEVTSDGHTVRLASPTEIGKNLYMFRKGMGEDLNKLIHAYKLRKSSPLAVHGNDTVEGSDSTVYTYPYRAID
jgi:hypothetical protein